MNYLLSRFNCYLIQQQETYIHKNVKYKISETNKRFLVVGEADEVLQSVNFCTANNVLKVEVNKDAYFILNSKRFSSPVFLKLKNGNKEFFLTLSDKLVITADNEIILDIEIDNITYSHCENVGELWIIYFYGKRKFIVVLEKNKLKCASYYDEYNSKNGEKLFMCRLNDSLNHGRVFKITNNIYEEYLVYLDDFELNLKERFVGFVFLDCLLAKNFNYCNKLLADEIKQKDSKNIELFFPKFDYYFEAQQNEFVLINKNALAGIYKFDIKSLNIINISQLDQ